MATAVQATPLGGWSTRSRSWLLGEDGLAVVWIVLTLLALLPVWGQRLLPMLDTPSHLALVRGWHSYHDPSYRIAEYYDLRVRPVPYLLFYGTIHILLYVVSIEVANKLFLSLYLILLPLSVLRLARALGRSPWLALGSFPLCFNQSWIYGFSSYLMGVALALSSLATLLDLLERPRPSRALGLMVLTFLTYFAHVVAWGAFGLCALALLGLRRRARPALHACAAMAPSAALAAWAIWTDRREGTYLKSAGFLATYHDLGTTLRELPRRVLEIFPGDLDLIVLIMLVVGIIVLLTLRGVRGEDDGQAARAIGLMLGVLFVLYLALPYAISRPMSWWYVGPRVAVMAAPLALLLPAGRFHGRQRLLLLPFVVAAVVLPLKLTRLYRSFSRRNAAFMELVDGLPRGASTFVVYRGMAKGPSSAERSGDPATSAPAYWHFGSWPMALHGGYGPHVFDQGVPIRPRHKLVAPTPAQADEFTFRQAPEFGYYLVRLAPDSFDAEPSVRLVARRGEWSLYQRTHALTDEP